MNGDLAARSFITIVDSVNDKIHYQFINCDYEYYNDKSGQIVRFCENTMYHCNNAMGLVTPIKISNNLMMMISLIIVISSIYLIPNTEHLHSISPNYYTHGMFSGFIPL